MSKIQMSGISASKIRPNDSFESPIRSNISSFANNGYAGMNSSNLRTPKDYPSATKFSSNRKSLLTKYGSSYNESRLK